MRIASNHTTRCSRTTWPYWALQTPQRAHTQSFYAKVRETTIKKELNPQRLRQRKQISIRIYSSIGRDNFWKNNSDYLTVAIRGYPPSTERYSEQGIIEDGLLVVDQLMRDYNGNVFIHGTSLGGAVAIGLAEKRPQVKGVIVENTFTSVQGTSHPCHHSFSVLTSVL